MDLLFFPFVRNNPDAVRRRLGGRTVLITGASYGIGEALTFLLAECGAHLLLVARSEDKLMEVSGRVEEFGGTAEVFACDLTDAQRLGALLDQLRQRDDGIDVVVSNAGRSIRRSLFDSLDRLHDVQRTIAINHIAPVQLLLGLVPALIKRHGQIINVSAVNVLLPPAPLWSAYQSSKAAFDQWFRCVAPELRDRGVAATTVYLPLVRTRMSEPTRAYDRVPAMSARSAAAVICSAMVTRRRRLAPWWTGPANCLASMSGRLWERAAGDWQSGGEGS